MPRRARFTVGNGIYHIMLRGNNRPRISIESLTKMIEKSEEINETSFANRLKRVYLQTTGREYKK